MRKADKSLEELPIKSFREISNQVQKDAAKTTPLLEETTLIASEVCADSSDKPQSKSGSKHASRTGSRQTSRQTSRTGSPVSILKKGGSRDASRDRSGMEELEDHLSRTGSLKKSASFNKQTLVDKKKISFDEDVDVEQFNSDAEPIAAAKQIFAAIANTSLDAGLAGRKSRSRDSSRDRLGKKRAVIDYSPGEPAEYFSQNESEFGNEDELMLVIDSNEDPETQAQYAAQFKDIIENKTASLPKMGKLGSRRNSE